MQKQVSKQSLAVLALSILLAISMALTATFAAFTASNSATGTIQFTNSEIEVVFEGWGASNALTLTNEHFNIATAGTDSLILNDKGIAAIKALKVSVTGEQAGYAVKLTLTAPEHDIATFTMADVTSNMDTVTDLAVITGVTPVAVSSDKLTGSFTVTVKADLVTKTA